MLRSVLGVVVGLAVFAGSAVSQDKDKNKDKPTKASITKIDAAKDTVTLKYKDRDGEEVTKTFDLKGDVKMYDKAGKVVTIDYYKLGGGVLVIERQGRLLELREDKDGK